MAAANKQNNSCVILYTLCSLCFGGESKLFMRFYKTVEQAAKIITKILQKNYKTVTISYSFVTIIDNADLL